MMAEVAVVVLAGGEGSRIGGEKPVRKLAGDRLIDRALKLARGYSDCVAVAVRDPAQIGAIDAEVIGDDPAEGPVGGLGAALRFAAASGRSLLLVIPADMPFLPDDLMDRLAETIGEKSCALASSGGHAHPVCSLWRAETLDPLPRYLATGRRSLRGFAELVGNATAEWPTGANDPFFNINSLEDLAEAERRLAR